MLWLFSFDDSTAEDIDRALAHNLQCRSAPVSPTAPDVGTPVERRGPMRGELGAVTDTGIEGVVPALRLAAL